MTVTRCEGTRGWGEETIEEITLQTFPKNSQ